MQSTVTHRPTKAAANNEQRTTFTTSRKLDYFSRDELTKQTGHDEDCWPLVTIKELVDNALDACEESGVQPEIGVKVTKGLIEVSDNGAGLPSETVEKLIDFDVRVSSREAYVAPDRGAQGNALKTVLAVPFVLDGDKGRVDIIARGQRHEITVRLDRIAQEPTIGRVVHDDGRPGTTIRLHWPANAEWLLNSSCRADIAKLVLSYAILNPHLRITLELPSGTAKLGNGAEWKKWTPNFRTSAHWYRDEAFLRLVSAHASRDRDRGEDSLLRDVIGQFDGMAGTNKRSGVLSALSMKGAKISSLVCNGDIDKVAVRKLHLAIRAETNPIKPARLGVIGREHLFAALAEDRCAAESMRYYKAHGELDGLPYVVEVAFGSRDDSSYRRLTTGINWSPAIVDPFREIGRYSLDGLLSDRYAGFDEPVSIIVHLAMPRPHFTDRGKSAVSLPDKLEGVIEHCVSRAVDDWHKMRKREERSGLPRREKKPPRNRQELRDAVFDCMLQGLQKASGNGRVDQVSARTLYYNVRELIQAVTDRELSWSNFNTLLGAYQREHGKIENLTRDPRGWVIEPHTQNVIPLGTREVGQYKIPPFLYDKILFVEKKGLHPILKAAKLAERFDMAIMCSEGFAPDAAKALLAAAERQKMTLFCLHDADPAGYLIAHVLRNGTAANPDKVKIIDIGLTLGEAMQLGLQGETFTRKKNLPSSLILNELEREHFTGTEITVKGKPVWKDCKRVELNALAADPDGFISFIERKLRLHKADRKLVPPKHVIKQFAAGARTTSLRIAIDEIIRDELDIETMSAALVNAHKSEVAIDGLPQKVRAWARGRRPEPWTACVQYAVSDRVQVMRKQLLTAVRARIAR